MIQSDDEIIRSVADKCYVDNLVTGADTLEEAMEIYKKVRTSFNQLSMTIRDWTSNSKEFLESTPSIHQYNQSMEVKVLGLAWDIDSDKLKLNWTESHLTQDSIDTKRKVLRALARIYDPCGFVCPLVLPMKLLFQKICEQKCKWDSILPEDITQSLKQILVKLKDITTVKVSRHLGAIPSDASAIYELHGFSDASKDSFAAVVYLKVIRIGGSSVSFVMAKSHVAQSKDKKEKCVNIPRLELLGFLITSRLLKYVKVNIGVHIHKDFLWTDSLVVLSWMRSDKLLPPFVSNRVEEIKKNLPEAVWYYINTKSNPADLATRPENWEHKKELWFNGPEFLKLDESYWPKDRLYDSHHNTLLSIGEGLVQSPGEQIIDTTKSSEQEQPNQDLTELDAPPQEVEATNELMSKIKKLQSECFAEELEGKRTHLVRNLELFVDVDGILRTRGRMGNTTWSYDMKHPILLPKDAELTRMIIKEAHESNYHVGAPHTLSILRKKYWIPQGKAQVLKVIKQCSRCIKHGGGPYNLPPAPPLPAERVTYNTPFTYTGVDYFGPLYVLDSSNNKVKRWVALFTCLTVRAIHLEVVKDLTAEECLLAIRRFAAARNTPKKIYSDNATYFRLTSEVMKQPFCIKNCIEWKFIPQLAPWHGGFYERMVGLVKQCLKRTLDKHLLNDSQLLTIIKEVENVVNARPLTKVGPELEHILSPSDFLSFGKCLTVDSAAVEIPATGTQLKVDLITSWKRGLKILEEFKLMFVNQYLASLRERYRQDPKQPRIKSQRVPHHGDYVQLKENSKNRDNWKVGKIVELIKGADGECRVAKVKVDDSIFTRSLGHLYPLEADSEEGDKPEPEANFASSDLMGGDNISKKYEMIIEPSTSVDDRAGVVAPVDVPMDT
ncbi:uncharacterized protein LOC126366932 [Pectinophora gossypiella]|uniref:uncharacterized protein LOC126366932 n=1 Tax=Pectinophora gossypiella TaxID=13191 RepID=UPI00214E6763|nr:uncharacterized protein LOC126366932 [Pectinophora gossypiella]